MTHQNHLSFVYFKYCLIELSCSHLHLSLPKFPYFNRICKISVNSLSMLGGSYFIFQSCEMHQNRSIKERSSSFSMRKYQSRICGQLCTLSDFDIMMISIREDDMQNSFEQFVADFLRINHFLHFFSSIPFH
jgi:hypothetical protein